MKTLIVREQLEFFEKKLNRLRLEILLEKKIKKNNCTHFGLYQGFSRF